MERICGTNISKSLVSKLVCTLDEELIPWRNRPLTKKYPYLVVDARYEKVRENGRVMSKAVVTVIGIGEAGVREVVGCWIIDSESYEGWNGCFVSLKERGLHGVEYVVSDENKGLRKALMRQFQGVKLQRCQVHFMRNLLSRLPRKDHSEGVQLLKEVFAAHTKDRAMHNSKLLIEYLLSKKKEHIADWIDENIEDALVVLDLGIEHRMKMKSTNMIERHNQELKRRTKVVRIFPNEASCLRLITAYSQEVSEHWCSRKYLTIMN